MRIIIKLSLLIMALFIAWSIGCEQPTDIITTQDNIPKPYNTYKLSFILNDNDTVLGDSAYYYYSTELDGWVIDVYQGECEGCGETIFLKDIQTIKIK